MYLLSALVFALIVAVFAVQNAQVVTLGFFGWGQEVSLSVVIIGAAAGGAVLAVLPLLFRHAQLRLKLWECEGRLDKLTAEHKRVRAELGRLTAPAQEANGADTPRA